MWPILASLPLGDATITVRAYGTFLVLAAAARGYQATVALMPQPSDPTHAASITLTPAPVTTSASYDAIGLRHSNRGPYTTQAVSTESLAALSAQADGLPGVSVRWFTSAS